MTVRFRQKDNPDTQVVIVNAIIEGVYTGKIVLLNGKINDAPYTTYTTSALNEFWEVC